MAELRTLLTGLGHTQVSTLLNSGNAVFTATTARSAAMHAAEIAKAISASLRVDVPVIVKSAQELSAIIRQNVLAERVIEPSRLLVVLVQDAKTLPDLAVISPLVVAPEEFLIGASAAYLHCASGILESKAGAALLGKIGKSATTRNWATVLKLQVLADTRK